MTRRADVTDAAVGEGLIALGLYGACFEAMVLAFRAKTQDWLVAHAPEELNSFRKACKTAHRTFDYCGPRLRDMGVIAGHDYDHLDDLRTRRNTLTHDAYQHVVSLRLEDLAGDLDQIDRLTRSVANWRVPPGPNAPTDKGEVGEAVPFTVSPALITGLLRQLAEGVVERRLWTDPPDD